MSDESHGLVHAVRLAMKCDNATHYGFIAKADESKSGATSSGMWRNALPHVFAALTAAGSRLPTDLAVADGDVFEFGVFKGGSLRLLHSMKAFAHSKLWGFDSFQGLPEGESGAPPAWAKGKFAADPRQELRRTLGGDKRIGFVQGWYSESLADGPALSRRLGMRPAK